MSKYNIENPIISFRMKEYQKNKLDNIAKKDARYEQTTDLIKEILIKYLSGELVENTESKEEYEQKIRKMYNSNITSYLSFNKKF